MRYKKLAFSFCLHGQASISLQDTAISPPHTWSFHVTGGLFSKVEPSLPKQNSIWIRAFLCRGAHGTSRAQPRFLSLICDCGVILDVPHFIIGRCENLPDSRRCSLWESVLPTKGNAYHIYTVNTKRLSKMNKYKASTIHIWVVGTKRLNMKNYYHIHVKP